MTVQDVPPPYTDPVIFIADIFQGSWPRTENQRIMKETWGIKPYYSRVLATVDIDIAVGDDVATITDVATKYEVMDFWGEFPRNYNPLFRQFRLLRDWDVETDGLFSFTPYGHYRYWGIADAKMEALSYFQSLTENINAIEITSPWFDPVFTEILDDNN